MFANSRSKMKVAVLLLLLLAGCYGEEQPDEYLPDDVKAAHQNMQECVDRNTELTVDNHVMQCVRKLRVSGVCFKQLRRKGLLNYMDEDAYQYQLRRFTDEKRIKEACKDSSVDDQEDDSDADVDNQANIEDVVKKNSSPNGPVVLIGLVGVLVPICIYLV